MGMVNHFQVVQYTGIIFLQAYKFLYQRTDVKLSRVISKPLSIYNFHKENWSRINKGLNKESDLQSKINKIVFTSEMQNAEFA